MNWGVFRPIRQSISIFVAVFLLRAIDSIPCFPGPRRFAWAGNRARVILEVYEVAFR
jgi:hypothetical protein